MKRLEHILIAVIIAGMISVSGLAFAKSGRGAIIDGNFFHIPADTPSGSGDTVEANCPADPSGNDWQGAAASLRVKQHGSSSKVGIKISDAAPDTLYTVWVRLQGKAHSVTFGGSPITGGVATPLSHTDHLAQLVEDWVGVGSPTQPNGVKTDVYGNAELELILDFPLAGGAYPFNRMSEEVYMQAQSKNPEAKPIPTAIVDLTDSNSNIEGPFMLRIVSHCQDGLGHGLSPGKREAWFQYPRILE